jgi:hypothetical protein
MLRVELRRADRRPLSPVLRNLMFALLALLVAACSGGGCSSGCSSCGTTPLPGGFPVGKVIPNAASARFTRPGLDFVQENLGTIAQKAIGANGTNGVISFDVPKSSQTFAGIISVNICSVNTPVPPQCQAEIDLGNSKLRINAVKATANRVKIDGLLPVRIRDLPITLAGIPGYVVAGERAQAPGQDLCNVTRASASFPYKDVPVNVELPLVKETRAGPRQGYTMVDVDKAIIDVQITKSDVKICASCGALGGLCQGVFDFVVDIAFDSLIGGITGQVKDALTDAFCTKPNLAVDPICPTGSVPDDADPKKAKQCNYGGTNPPVCVPTLLGTDGRMDLSKALASFSPGTQGGFDFVLASRDDMNPAPGETTVPAWTPRKPPIPAQDNNRNGLSLGFYGGAEPQPVTSCVPIAPNDPPQGIPVPAELTQDAITPWPASTPGPHLSIAIAGRFLSHAFVSTYNSGLLCLGISTDQVAQLNSGYLSLLAGSMKTLTLEQKPSSAAITTRPGAPPTVKIGGGTDVKTDPLLTITLPKFGVDFYVFAYDRYVRTFTFTGDVTVPVNLQTGKDPKTNPNGGILPVIGDLKIDKGVVTNADLLTEDPASMGGPLSALLGGIVGQFVGGGFKPIDVAGALKSVGLGLDIPPTGIRKLTSGSDDFIGIFANLTPAPANALEETDTTARIVEKIVHPESMSLSTARRELYPRLRVAVGSTSTRPVEYSTWIDDGAHGAWTRAGQGGELVVDRDAMLLQGRHVLYVTSRVVGATATEDTTPVALPFVIDTLPPNVRLDKRGDRARVSAWDYVSDTPALVARTRAAGGEWTEWKPLADLGEVEATADVEVRDEEGNVGRVTQPLIRGRADDSLSSGGSGCNCTTRVMAEGTGVDLSGLALAGLGLALVGARRRGGSSRR